ncbi:MAG: hypothetical protein M1833_001147 [Piccolia ochrophora]|nr:MAG: hypothetical protein M1833_001147 [Piccolia ochrophora]
MRSTALVSVLLRSLVVCVRADGIHGNLETRNDTVIAFDEITTSKGLANISSPYHHLVFSSGFSIIAPNDKALDDTISPNDRNCAVSRPNALIGSRYHPGNESDESAPFLKIHSTENDELSPYFDLLSFYIKPLDAPEPGTSIYLHGYSVAQDRPNPDWSVSFPAGYHEPLLVTAEMLGHGWDKLEKVAIWAIYGKEDDLDWEFCVDDLRVQRYGNSKRDGEVFDFMDEM